MNAGIPQAIIEMTLKFRYNDLENLRELFDQYPNQIACVVMEAEAATPPAPGYLAQVKELCENRGAFLVFDEMITGFRWHLGGAQKFPRGHSSPVRFRQGYGQRVCNRGAGRQTRDHAAWRIGPRSAARVSCYPLPTAPKLTLWLRRSKPSIFTANKTWSSFSGDRVSDCADLVNRSIAENRLEGFFQAHRTALQLSFRNA